MNPEIINYHIGAKIGLKKKEKQIYASMEEEYLVAPRIYFIQKRRFYSNIYGKSIFYSIRIFYLEGTNIFTSKRRTDSAEKSTWLYLQYCCLVLLALRHQQQQVRPRQCKSRRREANENIETELEVF